MNAGSVDRGHEELGDHLAALHAAAELRIEVDVVRLRIFGELVGVGPIELAVGRHVVARVLGKCPRFVGVGESNQAPPLRSAERQLTLGTRQIRRDRPVARKHSDLEELA